MLGVEFDNGDASALVMEYVQGDTLIKVIKYYGALPEMTIKGFARRILSGIAYMHSRNVIHRDIKSSNIMVISGTYIKIIDFGLAKRVTSAYGPQADSTSTLVGTLPYMAPELMRYESYDARIDVWSFAVVVYEMATGQPFLNFNGQH